ncbi:hypothetical protein DIRU0_C21330 [Diutina rugosa]
MAAARCDACKRSKRRCTAVEKPWAPCQRCVERKVACLFNGQARHYQDQTRSSHADGRVPTDPRLHSMRQPVPPVQPVQPVQPSMAQSPQPTMLEQIQTPLTPKSSYTNYQEPPQEKVNVNNHRHGGITVELLPETPPPPPPPSTSQSLVTTYPTPPKTPMEMYRHINEYYQMAGISDAEIYRFKRQLMEMLKQDCTTAEHHLVELIKDETTPIHAIEAACDQITTTPSAEWERVFYKELVAVVARRNDDRLTRVYMQFLRRWPQPYYAHRDMVHLRVHAAVPESIVFCE